MNRRDVIRSGAGALAACGARAWAAPKQTIRPAAWAPMELPLSFWCGPPDPHVKEEQYRRIAEAGFNYVMPPCSGATREKNLLRLELAQKNGLKVFLSDGRMPNTIRSDADRKAADAIIADYGAHPALAGYFLGDEPGAGAFPALGEVVAYFREKDPDHPVYLNLLPNYAPLDALGTKTYDDYVIQFIDHVRPFVVSYDHYHFTTGGDGPLFFANLESVRRVCLARNTPFWQIILTIQHFAYRKLTEPEQRYEVMQTLAYGGKGIMYFTYWTPDDSGMWGEGIIRFNGVPSYHYEHVKGINRDALALGKYLLPAESRMAYQTGPLPPGGTFPPPDAPVSLSGDVPATVGVFTDGKRHLALVASRDYKAARTAEVRIKTGGKRPERLDRKTGRWLRAEAHGDTSAAVVRVELAPGDAELFRW